MRSQTPQQALDAFNSIWDNDVARLIAAVPEDENTIITETAARTGLSESDVRAAIAGESRTLADFQQAPPV